MQNNYIAQLVQYKQLLLEENQNINQQQITDIAQILGELRAFVITPSAQDEIRANIEQQNFDFYDFYWAFLSKAKENNLEQEHEKQYLQIQSFSLQFLNNFITSNQQNKQFIFQNCIKHQETNKFQKIYDSFGLDHKYLKFMTIFIHNYLENNNNPEKIPEFLNNENTKTILKIIFKDYLGSIHETISYEDNSQTNQYYGWVMHLLHKIFTPQYPQELQFSPYKFLKQDLFQEEEKQAEKEKYSSLLAELFIQIFQKFTDDKVQFTQLKDYEPKSMDIRCQYINYVSYMFKFDKNDFQFMQDQYITHTQKMISLVRENLDQIHKEELPQDIQIQINFHLKNLFENIKIMCLITFLGGYNNSIQKLVMENQTLKFLLELLKLFRELNTVGQETVQSILEKNYAFIEEIKLEEIQELQKEEEQQQEKEENKGENQQIKSEWLQKMKELQKQINQKKNQIFSKVFDSITSQELFSVTLRLISNIVHINREAQDFIQQNGYLKECLSFSSGMQLNDPLAREWSIVLIRNLCDSNDEIQEEIAQMKLMKYDEQIKEIVNKYQQKRQDLNNVGQQLAFQQVQNNNQIQN